MSTKKDQEFSTGEPASSTIDLSNPSITALLPDQPTTEKQGIRLDAATDTPNNDNETQEKTRTPSKKKKKTLVARKTVNIAAAIPIDLAKRFDKVIEILDKESFGKVNRNLTAIKAIEEFVTKYEKKFK